MFVMLTIRRSHFLSTRCPPSPAHLSKSVASPLHWSIYVVANPGSRVLSSPFNPFPGSFPGIYPGRGNVRK